MKIGLIGMSGTGKTTWAKRLHAAGFTCYHCDDEIANRLQTQGILPISNFNEMGKWMGFPYEPGFAEREQQYLALEHATLSDILDTLDTLPPQQNAVIDTTGSVIYLTESLLLRLKQTVTLVYFAITPQVQQKMLENYLQQPRPIVWGGIFSKNANEPYHVTLARAYPKLVAYRQTLYEKLCTVKIEYNLYRQSNRTAQDLLEWIGNYKS